MKYKKYIIIMIILVIVLGLGLLLRTKTPEKDYTNSEFKNEVENSVISKDTQGYKLDLRIYGIYNKKSINKIVKITNFENTDKSIMITTINNDKTYEKEYIFKNNSYYEVKNGNLTKASNVPYEDTDIFLEGVKKIINVVEKEPERIGEKEYQAYTGKVSKSIMNKMLNKTDTGVKISTDAECEVWLTDDSHVHKVYYKADGITLYASYFGYNKASKIDLNIYKS